jgi:aspartyl-tRNA(Asn)/glutamyl-tRNA(Gln) amidotransferase subunit A
MTARDAATEEVCFGTARETARRIAAREMDPVAALATSLDRLRATEEHLHSFVSVLDDTAAREAEYLAQRQAAGEPLGPLHGVPVSVKDLIAVGGAPLTFGSRTMAGNVATADAPSVERLRREPAPSSSARRPPASSDARLLAIHR